ncbi:MAG: alpha/beta hydrolase [Rhodobacteraceae bacterium]|nr:alpha/beta hydrolase [Paracoccaceae bacterium]
MTVLLIPGLICDQTVWKPLVDLLDGNPAVADLTTQDCLTQMATDCLTKHDGPLQVAGHSMGARVAMEMARLAPDRITRLALLDTGIHPLADGEIDKRNAIVQFAHDNGMQALADRWLPGMIYNPNKTAALMQRLTDMVLRADPDLHDRHIHALINRPDAAAYLADIPCPTLLMVGRQDQWSPVSQHQDMLALLPNATLEIIENAGHFAPIEQPAKVAQLCADFLTG